MKSKPEDAVLNVQNIRIAMAHKGWNIENLSEETRVSRVTIGKALRTWRSSIDTALAITKALDLTPNQSLIGWEDPDESETENLAESLMSEQAVLA